MRVRVWGELYYVRVVDGVGSLEAEALGLWMQGGDGGAGGGGGLALVATTTHHYTT